MKPTKPDTFTCGHPTTESNTERGGKQYPWGRCRHCRTIMRRETRGVTAPYFPLPVVRPAPVLELDHAVEAIALYRTEKARRAERNRQCIADAKAALLAQQERDHEARKGGRPKGSGRGGQVTLVVPSSKPGKPRLNVTRTPAADALLAALPEWRGASS